MSGVTFHFVLVFEKHCSTLRRFKFRIPTFAFCWMIRWEMILQRMGCKRFCRERTANDNFAETQKQLSFIKKKYLSLLQRTQISYRIFFFFLGLLPRFYQKSKRVNGHLQDSLTILMSQHFTCNSIIAYIHKSNISTYLKLQRSTRKLVEIHNTQYLNTCNLLLF